MRMALPGNYALCENIRMQARRQSRVAAGLVVVVAAAVLSAGPALAAPSRKEIQARQEFAAGRYAAALELFAELYAQTLHPTYLRNIGRCHQELGDPDKAIGSFRQYLAKAHDLKPAERQEIEGFIGEMEALKRKREEAARPAPPPPPPVSLAARNPDPSPPPAMVAMPAQPEAESTPVYGRWWFWALVGGAVVAGGAGLWASGALGSKDASCPSGFTCQ
jgi:tetratricopeptide (TPR) repeat protein